MEIDVINKGDFFQIQHVRDSVVFKNTNESMDDLAEDFWLDKIKCYELNQVMRQSEQFIDILNRFRIATQTQNDIDIISSECVQNPPRNPKFPYLFNKNEPKLQHNESVFQRTEGNVYVFYKEDKHHDLCPKSFQLRDDLNETAGLHAEIRVKKDMLVELCVGNYATHDALVNNVDGLFKGSSLLLNSQTIIWILFNNSKIGHLTRIKNNHMYTQEIHPTWTPIEPISEEIQIGSNSNHIITRSLFPIQ